MEQTGQTIQAVSAVYIWVLGGVLGFVLIILIYVGKTIAKRVGDKLDELVKATIQQTEQIGQIFKGLEKQESKLGVLKKEIVDIKLNQHGCKNFIPKK
ncbi:MAG: hypothetical protein JEY96_16960 [Bacteroidales bacterium]|nr:hypothetical protein [Bacteroidales bacterium]